jgi:nitroreductase
MELTQEHEGIRRNVKTFIDKEINQHVDAWEQAGIFPAHELFKKMGDQGYLGINKPTKYGGIGLDYSYQLVFIETLGHIKCGGVPMAIGVQTDMATPALARFGSEELCSEFLVPSIKGDYVACLGVSEVGAGSDVASIKTTARKDGGDYVINGGKMWTTNGTQADWMCLLANTSDGPAHKNKSLICVPMKTKGVTDQQKLDAISKGAKAHLLAAPEQELPSRLREMLGNPEFQIFYHAPVLILISVRRNGPWAVEDCALAAQNLMLAARAQGLGTCWIGFAQGWLQTSEGKTALGLPAACLPVAPIIVGRPISIPPQVSRRHPQVCWVGRPAAIA